MTIDPITALTAHCILSCSDRLSLHDLSSLLSFYRDHDYQLALEFLVVYLQEGHLPVHEQEACDLQRLWRYWSQIDPHLRPEFPVLRHCLKDHCTPCRRTTP